jgi:hypothetical protein
MAMYVHTRDGNWNIRFWFKYPEKYRILIWYIEIISILDFDIFVSFCSAVHVQLKIVASLNKQATFTFRDEFQQVFKYSNQAYGACTAKTLHQSFKNIINYGINYRN